MSDNKTKTAPKNEAVFSLARLAKDCAELFGISTSTFAGAIHGLPTDCKMTVPDAKAHIKKWLDKPLEWQVK